MATTITSAFQKLKENLEITGLQATTVSSRQKSVRDNLAAEMTVVEDFLVGSYPRNTMISPLSEADVDIFTVLDAKYFEAGGQVALLDKVKRALAKSYKTSAISRNGQAVTIRFTDFRVDVVPAFNRKGGGYLIPDSIMGRWISTDPKQHISKWSESNKQHNGNFIPVIKMLKGWNKEHSSKLRSFHLECLARSVLNSHTITSLPSAVTHFFDQARWNYSSISDPSGYGGNVADYLDSSQKRNEVYTRLSAAYQKAQAAQDYEKAGMTASAFGKWQVIFGSYFPSYG